ISRKGPAPEAKGPPAAEESRAALQKPAPPPEPPKPPPKRESPKKPEPAKPLTSEEDEALNNVVVQAMGTGDWDRVIAVGNEAVLRGSKKDWAPYYLATAYAERDELDKALEYATRALQARPESRESLELRAQILAFRGEARKALADLEGLYGKKAGDLNKQITALKDAKDARSLLQRGVFYTLKRHHDSAEKDFEAALGQGLKPALVWRAHARRAQENRAGAIEDLKAYRAALPTGYATDEVAAMLKDLGAN
ncbi:MAG TPA: hypothetical protein VJB14_17030, partial [Planctomycetota bacterium]|nr:hypothetical protein [Planctomycetota bacterium]